MVTSVVGSVIGTVVGWVVGGKEVVRDVVGSSVGGTGVGSGVTGAGGVTSPIIWLAVATDPATMQSARMTSMPKRVFLTISLL
jgi:hypothetical protein